MARTSGWFAGGEEPTSADYMMIFPLEALNNEEKTVLGPKTIEYVKRAHERYELHYLRALMVLTGYVYTGRHISA